MTNTASVTITVRSFDTDTTGKVVFADDVSLTVAKQYARHIAAGVLDGDVVVPTADGVTISVPADAVQLTVEIDSVQYDYTLESGWTTWPPMTTCETCGDSMYNPDNWPYCDDCIAIAQAHEQAAEHGAAMRMYHGPVDEGF